MATKTATPKARANGKAPTTLVDVASLDIVSITEIAERIGVPRVTVEKWRQRSKAYATSDDPGWAFPAPRWVVANGKTGLWLFDQDIVPWLEHTDRTPEAGYNR